MIKRILVPVDFSKPSAQAVDYAVAFPCAPKAELVLFHAVEPAYFGATAGIYGAGYDIGIVYRELERAAREQLSALAAKLRARRVAVRVLLTVGVPHRMIAEAARKVKANLIIMSTHGRTGLGHALMGSVAERVVRTAPCPVLTLHPRRAAARRHTRRGTSARAPGPERKRSRPR